MVILLALACADPGPAPVESAAPAQVEPLGPEALLARLSLDLRGVRPTEDELRQVVEDPAAVEVLVAQYLREPGFGERLVHWYGDLLRTRADRFIPGADGDGALMDSWEKARFLRAVGDEPLRLLADIATHEQPWTDWVTVDYTVVNEHLIDRWPLEDLDGTVERGWRRARYTDGRPAAGVLSTNGMWWRYTSTIENVNRSRAQAVATALLCDRRFERPVEFSASQDVTDNADLQGRAQTDPACVSCHVMLDPLGSYLYGFWRFHPESYSEAAWYFPERERLWEDKTGIAPGFYGTPGEGLYDLGHQIAADPRYVSCAVERAWDFLFGELPGAERFADLTGHREEFITGGLTLQALYGSVAANPLYRAASADAAEGALGLKRMDVDQLGRSVEALTGFSWTFQDLGMLDNDAWGVRVLAGGMDGIIVTEPATDHSTTGMLVIERLSEAAAHHAVDTEAALDPAERRLFREVADLGATPTAEEARAQVAALVLRVHSRSVALDDPELDALVALFDALLAEHPPETSWALLLSALLRHPDFLHY